jgi:hypothetical protein
VGPSDIGTPPQGDSWYDEALVGGMDVPLVRRALDRLGLTRWGEDDLLRFDDAQAEPRWVQVASP